MTCKVEGGTNEQDAGEIKLAIPNEYPKEKFGAIKKLQVIHSHVPTHQSSSKTYHAQPHRTDTDIREIEVCEDTLSEVIQPRNMLRWTKELFREYGQCDGVNGFVKHNSGEVVA